MAELKRFVVMMEWANAIKNLTTEQKGMIFENFISLTSGENNFNTEDPTVEAIWGLLEPNVVRMNADYMASVTNGKKGGRPPKKVTETKPKNNLNKPKPNLTETDKDKDKANDKAKAKVNVKVKAKVNTKVKPNYIPKKEYMDTVNDIEDIEEGKLYTVPDKLLTHDLIIKKANEFFQ